MSAVATITKLATEVVGRTAHVVTHPVGTVSTVAGKARGIASSVLGESKQEVAPTPEAPADPPAAASPVADFGADTLPEPTVIEPAEPEEPFVTEPKAASREGAHGGRGEEPSDDWHEEIDEGPEVTTSAGTTGVAPEINPATGLPHHAGE